jgi:serine/threonine-protein kinase
VTDNSQRIVLNDRYEVQQRIGRGGMADVFLARDLLLDRPVAIKVLFPEFAVDPNFVERFRREAQSAANLNHPNIVSVYDWGKYSNTYFMAMEYVQGRTLADILKANGHVSSVQAAEIASEVSAALGFAHKNGVVHRDIKPANILIGSGGQVKVADFGIARAMNAPTESNLTQVGSVMGTATYFSPEQAQGAQPDPRSDLYSLGIVLYEMVAGQPPFTGDNPVGIAYKQVHDAPRPLNQIVADVPRPFEAIVAKLLAKKPEQRYADAESLRDDLRRFRSGEHVLALGPPPQPVQAPPIDVVSAAAGAAAVGATLASPATARAQAAYTSAASTSSMARTTAMPAAGRAGGPPPQQVAYIETPSRNGLYAVLGFLAVAALVVGGIFLYRQLSDKGTTGSVTTTTSTAATSTSSLPPVTVPNVIGKTFDEVSKLLGDLGLQVTPVPQDNPAVPENQVFKTDPAADVPVAAGSAIQVFFNPVKQPQPVPDVTGKAVEEAKRVLQDAQFTIGAVTSENSDLPADTVIRTDPLANTSLKVGSPVGIVVSAGPNTQTIPDVSKQTEQAATAALSADPFKFKVTSTQEASSTVAAGIVLRTEPAAGGQLAPGAGITIIVSSGAPKITVPGLEGLTEAQARTLLSSNGLVPQVRYQPVPAGDANDGRVISQNTPAGALVDPGTAVRVLVGQAVAPATTTTSTTLPPTTTAATTTAPPTTPPPGP